MTYIKSYKDLIVWQKSMLLVKEIYILTSRFPESELFGMVSQMRRAVISIPSNIAEGYGRGYIKEYIHFYSIAFGSALELETQLIIAKELLYVTHEDYERVNKLLEEVCKMLNAMISKMEQKNKTRR